jgi:hypothetical protein
MPCANKIANKMHSSREVIPHPINIWMGWAAITKAIVTIIDALIDALEMQRAAHRRSPLIDE